MLPSPVQQAAAIPLREGKVCVVSSRSGKRWVVPKGCIEPNRTASQIAVQEAWEEAGLTGILQPHPVGAYVYEKSGRTFAVTVFVMHVTAAAMRWPEVMWRRRLWLSEEEATQRVEPAGLQSLLRMALSRELAQAT
jgi:8-oxo-dGTP pyrophosphatase MutT (NUDIX family)